MIRAKNRAAEVAGAQGVEAGAPESSAVSKGDARTGEGRPRGLRLERRSDGQLWAIRGGEARPVRVRMLFPWSEAEALVSLRDASNKEWAVIGPDVELDPESTEALNTAARAASFVLEITCLVDVEDEVELRVWTVETRQGRRTFQTRLDEWPREVPGGGYVIRDVAGDLYLVSMPDSLDARSRQILWAFAG